MQYNRAAVSNRGSLFKVILFMSTIDKTIPIYIALQNSNNNTHPDLNIQLQQNHQQNYQQNHLQNHQQNHQQKQNQQQQTVVLPASIEKMVPQLQRELQGSSTSIARTPTKTQFVF